VKIDGFRIELAEIEQVFARSLLVDKAVAIVRHGRLALYIKPSPGLPVAIGPSQLEEMKTTAARSLTYYMMPKTITIMDDFPQTANGKLDRNALPDPRLVIEENVDATVGNASMTNHVCGIFQKVRGRRPNATSSFSAMGIDSLGAIMFIRLLSESLGGIKISPAEVYANGVTIQSFSDALHRRLITENPRSRAQPDISSCGKAYSKSGFSCLFIFSSLS